MIDWQNSPGVIAGLDRGSIGKRVLDVQKCLVADPAIVRIVTDTF